jgi:hypothetical protein
METIVIVNIHRKPLDLLSGTPGTYEKPSAPAHYSTHVEATLHSGRVIDDILGGIKFAVQE